jgi:hypothetical protein
MINKRKSPAEIQDFEKLRRRKNVYMDKTAYIHRLQNTDAPYFPGRPRRFGRSLFKAYFPDRKELSESLAISETEKDCLVSFAASGKRLTKTGIAFSAGKRRISWWIVE